MFNKKTVTLYWTLFNCFLETVGIYNICKIHTLLETTNQMKKIVFLLLISLTFSSCYVHKNIIGTGAQKGIVETAKQHNFVYGLVSGKTPTVSRKQLKSVQFILIKTIKN